MVLFQFSDRYDNELWCPNIRSGMAKPISTVQSVVPLTAELGVASLKTKIDLEKIAMVILPILLI